MEFRLNKPKIYALGRQVVNNIVQESKSMLLEDQTPTISNREVDNINHFDSFYGPIKIAFTTEYTQKNYDIYDLNKILGNVNYPIDGDIENLAEIRYTVNGDIPNKDSKLYTRPINIYYNLSGSMYTVLKAKVYYLGKSSDVITVYFYIYHLLGQIMFPPSGSPLTPEEKFYIENLGVPVATIRSVNRLAGEDGNGDWYFYLQLEQRTEGAPISILKINPDTETLEQFNWYPVPETGYDFFAPSGSSRMSYYNPSDGHNIYMGTYGSVVETARLLRFNLNTEVFEDLGNATDSSLFITRIDEDQNGLIWMGTWPDCSLAYYDPATNIISSLGRIEDDDVYCYPYVNNDGFICCFIKQVNLHVVVVDPDNPSTMQTVGPTVVAGTGTFDAYKAIDGWVYIESSEGNFKIEGFDAVPHGGELPRAEYSNMFLPNGDYMTVSSNDDYKICRIYDENGVLQKTFDLEYDIYGNDIFLLSRGPDNKIYGSSEHPLRLFSYNPSNEQLVDYGKCSESGGHAYSMLPVGNDLYIFGYTQGYMSRYNPSLPYNYGSAPGSNPINLGRVDDIMDRPSGAVIDNYDRIWTCGRPGYGLVGGSLASYDISTEEKNSYRYLAGNGALLSLVYVDDNPSYSDILISGGTRYSGTGVPPIDDTSLFIIDIGFDNPSVGPEVIWEGHLSGQVGHAISHYNGLLYLDGKIYGTTDGGVYPYLYVFDVDRREFTHHFRIDYLVSRSLSYSMLDNGLSLGRDGYIYGFSSHTIFRFNPKKPDDGIEIVYFQENFFDRAGPIANNILYFGSKVYLYSAHNFLKT